MTTSVRLSAAVGSIAGLMIVAAGLFDARAALAGWLAGFALWGAVPLGALLIAMMARLIPGSWRAEVAASSDTLIVLLPLLGIAVLPVLLGMSALYPWSDEPNRLYLSAGLFALRSLLLLAILIALGGALLLRPAWAVPLSSGGLVLFVLLDTTLAVDWLLSLEPHFHSSGFGLYVIAIQANVALVVIVLMRLRLAGASPRLLGALLLVGLLLWAYLAFMQYFIAWSDNLPEAVRWYRNRGTGVWADAEIAIGALHLIPLLLLFLNPVRASRTWLRGIAAAILLGKAIEIAWLVFPATGTVPWIGATTGLLAVVALSGLSIAFLAGIAQSRGVRVARHLP